MEQKSLERSSKIYADVWCHKRRCSLCGNENFNSGPSRCDDTLKMNLSLSLSLYRYIYITVQFTVIIYCCSFFVFWFHYFIFYFFGMQRRLGYTFLKNLSKMPFKKGQKSLLFCLKLFKYPLMKFNNFKPLFCKFF